MNDTALFRRIENANCRMQDLKHIDKREALRVKWLTHGAQKKKYEKWEETAVEYGFAGPTTDDAERQAEGHAIFYDVQSKRVGNLNEMSITLNMSPMALGGRPGSVPSSNALSEAGIPACKSSVKITGTFAIIGTDEALPPHFTCQSAAESPRVNPKLPMGFQQVLGQYGYNDVSFCFKRARWHEHRCVQRLL